MDSPQGHQALLSSAHLDSRTRRHAFCMPCRYVIVAWLHAGLVLVYAMRVNLSVAIEKMQQQFGWSDATKGFVLSAFFIGYFVGQMPGGYLATRFGGKWVFGLGVLATAIFTLLLPFSTCGSLLCALNTTNTTMAAAMADEHSQVHQRSYLVVLGAVRVLMGVFESVTFPAVYALLSSWTPPDERSRMVSFTLVGAQVGTAMAFPISGYLASLHPAHEEGIGALFVRWPGVFYSMGLAGVLWFAGWSLFAFSSPASHPRIGIAERTLLENAIGPSRQHSPPLSLYIAFFTTKASLACFVNHFTNNWSLYLMLTAMPSYLDEQLGFDLQKAGFLSVLPYLGYTLLTLPVSVVADWLTPRLGRRRVRVLMQLSSNATSALCFVCLGFITDVPVAVALTTLAVAVGALTNSGVYANYLDICPKHGGVFYSVSNVIATIPGVVAPILTGLIVQKPPKLSQWRAVFAIAAGVYAVGCIVWVAWCHGEPIPALNPEGQTGAQEGEAIRPLEAGERGHETDGEPRARKQGFVQ
jgi:MFS family permease